MALGLEEVERIGPAVDEAERGRHGGVERDATAEHAVCAAQVDGRCPLMNAHASSSPVKVTLCDVPAR